MSYGCRNQLGRRRRLSASFNRRRHSGRRRVANKMLERQVYGEVRADAVYEFNRQQGVPAKLKEIVVDADSAEAKAILPYLDNCSFHARPGFRIAGTRRSPTVRSQSSYFRRLLMIHNPMIRKRARRFFLSGLGGGIFRSRRVLRRHARSGRVDPELLALERISRQHDSTAPDRGMQRRPVDLCTGQPDLRQGAANALARRTCIAIDGERRNGHVVRPRPVLTHEVAEDAPRANLENDRVEFLPQELGHTIREADRRPRMPPPIARISAFDRSDPRTA